MSTVKSSVRSHSTYVTIYKVVFCMFYPKFEKLCKENKVSPSKVASDIGLSKSSATYWKRGSEPRAEILFKIADYFNVSPLYFFDEDEKKEIQTMQEILADDKTLDQEEIRSHIFDEALHIQTFNIWSKACDIADQALLQATQEIPDQILDKWIQESIKSMSRSRLKKLKLIKLLEIAEEWLH